MYDISHPCVEPLRVLKHAFYQLHLTLATESRNSGRYPVLASQRSQELVILRVLLMAVAALALMTLISLPVTTESSLAQSTVSSPHHPLTSWAGS